MFDSLKPGQTVKCTVTRDVRRTDDYQTVQRLMRLDPEIKRALKAAQDHRNRTLYVRSRGKRPWEVRVKSAKFARPVEGATWLMRWFPHIEADCRAVSDYIKVEPA
ncbi:MAG: hypothetical protein KDA21_04105 [Phycisphaerales bacterium]|nr:hypothetical protein [Phycisphaerales bacterium]